MAGPKLIATTSRVDFRPLGHQGRPAYEAAQQLRALVGRRLGPRHSAYLAEPVHDPDLDRIDWYAAIDGAVAARDSLVEAERNALDADAASIETDLTGLADQLQEEPGRAALADLIRTAIRSPGAAMLFRVGGQPVRVAWSFTSWAEAVPSESVRRAPSRPATPPPNTPQVASLPPADGTATLVNATPGWLLWLLPLLMLTLLLLLLLEAWISDRWPFAEPVPQGPDPVRLAQNEYWHLKEELARLHLAVADARLDRCIAAVDHGDRLVLPEAGTGSVAFLEGCWQSTTTLRDKDSGHPLVTRYCFDSGGQGTAIVIAEDGSQCSGTATASFNDSGQLLIIEPEDLPCPDRRRYYRSSITCGADDFGRVSCAGEQSNGNRFGVRLDRAAAEPAAPAQTEDGEPTDNASPDGQGN